MQLYTGIIEDVNDPLELGRARVRVTGVHAFDEVAIPTESLPWAVSVLPVTSASAEGVGITPRYIPFKTWCLVYFLDPDEMQVPIIIGTVPGIATDTILVLNGEKGQYSSQANPSDKWKNQSDLPGQARSGPNVNPRARIQVTSDVSSFTQPESVANLSRYPYNQVTQSESGHLEEVDDTPGAERLSRFHRTGSGEEIGPDGTIEKIAVGENYEIYHSNNNIYVEGVCNVHINSDANVFVNGDYNMNVSGDYNLHVKGKYSRHVGDTAELVTAGDEVRQNASVYHTVAGYHDIQVQNSYTLNSLNYTLNCIDEIDVISNKDITIGATDNLITAAQNITSMANESYIGGSHAGTVHFSSGTSTNIVAGEDLYVTSTTTTTMAADAEIHIGTGKENVVVNGVNIFQNNTDTVAPELRPVTPYEFKIPTIEQIDMDLPNTEFNEPSIIALDPDTRSRRLQFGTREDSEYRRYVEHSLDILSAEGSPYIYNTETTSPVGRYNDGRLGSGTALVIPDDVYSSEEWRRLLNFIARNESEDSDYGAKNGWNVVNNGTEAGRLIGLNLDYKNDNGVELKEMTIGEILELQRGTRATGRRLFAVGRYQFDPLTLKEYALPDSGLTTEDKFSKANQNKLCFALLLGRRRPPLAAYLSGKSTDLFAAHLALSQQYDSIPDPNTGRSYYGNVSRAEHTIGDTEVALREAREFYLDNQNTNPLNLWTQADEDRVEDLKRFFKASQIPFNEDELTDEEKLYAKDRGYI